MRSQPVNPKNTVISRDLHILVAVVNTFHFMDVLIIGEPRLKEKIVDGKGNIQSGKNVHHGTNCQPKSLKFITNMEAIYKMTVLKY